MAFAYFSNIKYDEFMKKNEPVINNEKLEETEKLSFVQMWERSRKAGVLYYTFSYGLYAFMTYLFIKMLYCLYIKDFDFKVDWWAILICLVIGPSFYYICEAIYKKKGKKSE